MTQYTKGPWECDEDARSIWCKNEKIGGLSKIFDVRGWGYLTGMGHGALGLPEEQAIAIQKANGKLAAAAPDMHEALERASRLIEVSAYKFELRAEAIATLTDIRTALSKAGSQ